MIVERVPSFLSSPHEYDYYVFDKNGRFIYVRKHSDELDPTFIIYDVMFNDYM
jgi:hypothetical protein